MNDLPIRSGPTTQTMTVRQVADALNISERTVQEHAKANFPQIVRNGMATFLDEYQVTVIKRAVEKSGRNDLANVREVSSATTSLEIEEMTLKVIAYHKAEADRLRAELAEAAPKIACADALMCSDRCMSITDAAKHFGLHPKAEVFPYLRARGYLTQNDLPTQPAIDAGYLSLKETKAQDGRVWPQAVVEAWQLERWRAHVVHQVKHYAMEVRP